MYHIVFSILDFKWSYCLLMMIWIIFIIVHNGNWKTKFYLIRPGPASSWLQFRKLFSFLSVIFSLVTSIYNFLDKFRRKTSIVEECFLVESHNRSLKWSEDAKSGVQSSINHFQLMNLLEFSFHQDKNNENNLSSSEGAQKLLLLHNFSICLLLWEQAGNILWGEDGGSYAI